MGYDLAAKDKSVKTISVGAFTWPMFLQETGMGYVLGYGAGRRPASYVYQTGNSGSPSSNDGYKVSSSEAKMMAKVARGFVSVQRFVNKEWDELPEIERKQQMDYVSAGKLLYRPYWHEDHLKWLESFAEFAEKSKGFTIH